uniref:ALMS motif domain-containing protein n=1 Tax=Onchocerca volvulus TaxID=6282 RepID=A0A8R1TPY7_ONCVO
MFTEETDLIRHLVADNRKLQQLYLAERQKALTERKRRIVAEARLAAFLGKKIIERRWRNSYNLLEGGRNVNSTDSWHEDQTALIFTNNTSKYRKNNSTSESNTEYTASSARNMQDVNISKTNLLHSVRSSKHSIDPLNSKTNSAQFSSTVKLPQSNFEKSGSTALSKFWLFIDRNGETKSTPPQLNQIQQKRKEAFIRRSIERQILIQEASARRKELAAAKRKIAKQLLAGHKVNRNAVQMLSLMDREIHAFPPQAMKHETIRRICKTREFRKKEMRQRKEYDVHINRLLAYCYSQVPYKLYQRH